jgi:hypothetical protein
MLAAAKNTLPITSFNLVLLLKKNSPCGGCLHTTNLMRMLSEQTQCIKQFRFRFGFEDLRLVALALRERSNNVYPCGGVAALPNAAPSGVMRKRRRMFRVQYPSHTFPRDTIPEYVNTTGTIPTLHAGGDDEVWQRSEAFLEVVEDLIREPLRQPAARWDGPNQRERSPGVIFRSRL